MSSSGLTGLSQRSCRSGFAVPCSPRGRWTLLPLLCSPTAAVCLSLVQSPRGRRCRGGCRAGAGPGLGRRTKAGGFTPRRLDLRWEDLGHTGLSEFNSGYSAESKTQICLFEGLSGERPGLVEQGWRGEGVNHNHGAFVASRAAAFPFSCCLQESVGRK